MRISAIVVALFASMLALMACASILGLDPLDVYDASDALAPDAAGDATPAPVDGGAPGEGGSIGEIEDVACDPAEQPPASAVYVSASYDGGTPSGSAAAPYTKIADAIPSAKADNAAIVVEEGTYPESLSFEGFGGGAMTTIDGAWTRTSTGWARDCSLARVAKTVIRSSSDVGLRFANNQGVLGVSNLTVESRPTAAATAPDTAGASRYGVFVVGSSVKLTAVHIRATAGDPGGAATGGAAGEPLCQTSWSCEDGLSDGDAGTNGSPASTFGKLAATGFVPADGASDATKGQDGSSGKPGTAGQSRSDCSNGCNSDCDTPSSPVKKTSTAGACGCGGGGGEPGSAGRGGGASVAIFASGTSAVVTVNASLLTAGAGGAGSAGGLGGAGGSPANGVAGQDADCYEQKCCAIGSCPSSCGCYHEGNWNPYCSGPAPGNTKIPGGAAGGRGTPGGKGGDGGGGAGGPSFVVVSVEGAQIIVKGSKRSYGNGGGGAGGAPGGPSRERY